ncbi:MAG TPA: macro domain-containing protein [Bryobacteraceae bacterium]|nr:macro domain-containing protein [Bryobacteraceae bacterium]
MKVGTGNLLEADAEALVNTVNTEGVMGKGIALQFKKKYPDMYEEYRRACEAGEVQPGRMHVFERTDTDMLNPRFIINFPTKRHWRSPARMEDLESGLRALVSEIKKRNIRSVAIPPLGCGNGGLDWAIVGPTIQRALSELKDVSVLLYPPAGAPKPSEIVHQTKRPEMNPSRAITLKIWTEYFALGYRLTLLEVHKLLYFLQEAGESLRLRFQKDRYGPYADNLRHLLHRFEGHFSLGFGDGKNSPVTEIELLAPAVKEAEEFLQEHAHASRDSIERLARVAGLIKGFESPYGLELLATVHWARVHEKKVGTFEELHDFVQSWSPRKSKLLKREHLELAYRRLEHFNWLSPEETNGNAS